MTIPSKDNLSNYISMLEKNASGGRIKCFFCKLVNAIFTVVIVVAVAAVACVVMTYTLGAAVGFIVPAGAAMTAGIIGGALGGAIAVGSAISDQCISIIDYGQDPDTGTIFGYQASSC